MSGISEDELKKRFGDNLRRIRKEKGLSQESLALSSDLDRTYIGGIERGERNVSLLNICKLATALDVSVQDFFDGI